jgi:uncharacterized SAM-binding protein YcdF (DUF218 family)
VRRGQQGGIFLRLLLLLLCLGFFAFFYAVRRPLLRFAGEYWVIDEPAAPSDALIVLGDDNYAADRAFQAAGLYRAGVAPVVVASGRLLRQNVSLAEVMQHDLQSYGVPAPSIVKLSNRAENTREEAVEVARLIRAKGWKRIIVVTSNYHARRTRFIYGRVLPSSVSFRVSGARDSQFDPSRWWETRMGQKLFLSELASYLVARWELRSGPSTRSEAAGMNSRAPTDVHGPVVPRQLASASLRPYQIGNKRIPWGSPRCLRAYYSSKVTVFSGLLRILPSLAVTEFSVGGKHVA